MAGQFFGAFLAAALVFGVYHTRWIQYDPALVSTAGTLTSCPGVQGLGFWGSFVDLLVGTAILTVSILVIGDRFNNTKGVAWSALGIALAQMAVSTAFGQHSLAINPARDLGPRLFVALAGFRGTGFRDLVWFPGVLGPFAGALIGAYICDFSIGRFLEQVTGVQGLDPEYSPVVPLPPPTGPAVPLDKR